MTKFSVFIKNPGGSNWVHWGWFDTRRDARDEAVRQKFFCSDVKTRIRHVDISRDDFAAIALAMI